MDILKQKLNRTRLSETNSSAKDLANTKTEASKAVGNETKTKTPNVKTDENGILLKEENKNTAPFRHLVSKNVSGPNFKKFVTMAHRGATYSLKYLKGPSQKFLESKKMVLEQPKNSKKKFLMLDLDQTLIHTVSSSKEPYEVSLELDSSQKIMFNVRPYCYEFLKKMSQHYTVYVFTASTTGYARPIIDYLNRNLKTIHDVLTRSNCMETKNGFYIKDLRIIANRELKDIVLVDNLVHSFGLQIDNGIPILEYKNDDKDAQLKFVAQILMAAKDQQDVRRFLANKIGLKGLIEVDQKLFDTS